MLQKYYRQFVCTVTYDGQLGLTEALKGVSIRKMFDGLFVCKLISSIVNVIPCFIWHGVCVCAKYYTRFNTVLRRNSLFGQKAKLIVSVSIDLDSPFGTGIRICLVCF